MHLMDGKADVNSLSQVQSLKQEIRSMLLASDILRIECWIPRQLLNMYIVRQESNKVE